MIQLKNLVDNIKDTVPNQESRFAILYKDIHSGKKEEETETETETETRTQTRENQGSQFSNLINTMGSLKSNERFNGNNSNNNNNFADSSRQKKKNSDNIDSWKSFTNDLMSSSQSTAGNDLKNTSSVLIEKDEEDDDLLTGLFGDEHKPD